MVLITLDLPSTKDQLLATACKLLESQPPESITCEQILLESGFSQGSLYRHYVDFSDLMETAQVKRFADYVSGTLEEFIAFLEATSDPIMAKEKFHQLAQAQRFADSLDFRLKRLRITYSAATNERMKLKLAPIQEQLTQKWMRIHNICLERHWANTDLDSRAASLILQSTIIGRILDDNASNHIDAAEWVHALEFIFDTFFFNKIDLVTGRSIIPSDHSEILTLLESDPRCKELENNGYEIVNKIRNSTLKLSKMTDVTMLNDSYVNVLYKMYRIEIIGPEFTKQVALLQNSAPDLPDYPSAFDRDFPNLASVPELWEDHATLYGAFFHNELVGYLRVQNHSGTVEILTCNIHYQHRAGGLASGLVAYAILSKQNKGINNFISKNDDLVPVKLAILTRLGFVASASTFSYARKPQV